MRAMRYSIPVAIVILSLSAGCGHQPQTINSDQLGKGIIVIGPLGPSIGEVITVRGHCGSSPPNSNQPLMKVEAYENEDWVRIEEVNGHLLEKPIAMEIRPLHGQKINPSRGMGFKAVGYQNGAFEGFPDHPACRVIQSRGRQFHVYFIAIEYHDEKENHEPPATEAHE